MLQFILQDEDSCMVNKCYDYISDEENGQCSIIPDTDHSCQSMQVKREIVMVQLISLNLTIKVWVLSHLQILDKFVQPMKAVIMSM